MGDTTRDDFGAERRGGFGDFLRGLLSGIPWSERAEDTETLVIDAPPCGALRIDNTNGRTRVIGEQRTDIELQLHKTARAESVEEAEALIDEIRVTTRQEADHLQIEFDIPRRWNRRGRVDAEVRVPRDLDVAVLANNGPVCVRGLRSRVSAKLSNGAVRIEDVIGDIAVTTSNAKVKTTCTCGHLTTRSSNGKIELDDHRGSVDASTSNGTISCELDALGPEGVILATRNGRIVLELPDDVDGDVDLRVDNGVIRSSREMDDGVERSGRMKGTLGHGGAPIRLRASNGSISLK